jgi:hypothetical protein
MEVAPEGEGAAVTITLIGAMEGALGGLSGAAMKPGVARDNRRTVEQFEELACRALGAPAPAWLGPLGRMVGGTPPAWLGALRRPARGPRRTRGG